MLAHIVLSRLVILSLQMIVSEYEIVESQPAAFVRLNILASTLSLNVVPLNEYGSWLSPMVSWIMVSVLSFTVSINVTILSH